MNLDMQNLCKRGSSVEHMMMHEPEIRTQIELEYNQPICLLISPVVYLTTSPTNKCMKIDIFTCVDIQTSNSFKASWFECCFEKLCAIQWARETSWEKILDCTLGCENISDRTQISICPKLPLVPIDAGESHSLCCAT